MSCRFGVPPGIVFVLLLVPPPFASAENIIKDLSGVPQGEVSTACDAHDWQACREMGERAHYGKGVTQDLDAAGRFYGLAKHYADASDRFRGMANDEAKTLELDRHCAALGAKIQEPGWIKEGVEDCALDYYEAKASGDFKTAVACAQRAQQAETLAMLYANGRGVARDLDRAIRAACEYRDVSAERDGMLRALLAMKDDDSRDEFDFCKYATSGHSAYRCTMYIADAASISDESALAAARAKWSAATAREWSRLEPIAEAYFDAEATASTYGARFGTAYPSLFESALSDLRHAFATMVVAADAFSPTAVKDAGRLGELDRELNVQYSKSLHSIEDADEKAAIKAAERAWIPYRDAVAAFFEVELAGRFAPKAVTQAMLARLTSERLERLRASY